MNFSSTQSTYTCYWHPNNLEDSNIHSYTKYKLLLHIPDSWLDTSCKSTMNHLRSTPLNIRLNIDHFEGSTQSYNFYILSLIQNKSGKATNKRNSPFARQHTLKGINSSINHQFGRRRSYIIGIHRINRKYIHRGKDHSRSHWHNTHRDTGRYIIPYQQWCNPNRRKYLLCITHKLRYNCLNTG